MKNALNDRETIARTRWLGKPERSKKSERSSPSRKGKILKPKTIEPFWIFKSPSLRRHFSRSDLATWGLVLRWDSSTISNWKHTPKVLVEKTLFQWQFTELTELSEFENFRGLWGWLEVSTWLCSIPSFPCSLPSIPGKLHLPVKHTLSESSGYHW